MNQSFQIQTYIERLERLKKNVLGILANFDAYHPTHKETLGYFTTRYFLILSITAALTSYSIEDYINIPSLASLEDKIPILIGFTDKIEGIARCIAITLLCLATTLPYYIYTLAILKLLGNQQKPNIYRLILGNMILLTIPYVFISSLIFLSRLNDTWTGDTAYKTIGITAFLIVFIIPQYFLYCINQHFSYINSFFKNSFQKTIYFCGILFLTMAIHYCCTQ